MSTVLSPAASCSIAPERRASGPVMLRPISQLKHEPEADHADADAEDQELGVLLRGRDAFGGGGRPCGRPMR